MFSKLKEKLNIYKKDNKGAAIVVAIVAIAFIGMLVGMLVYMAYYNYLMKHIDKKNKDNFYSAEYALDIINAGLQQDISDSMSEAYVKAMKNSAGMTAENMTLQFKTYFVNNLQERIADPTDSNKWNATHLINMWTAADLATVSVEGETGAYLGTTDVIPAKQYHLELTNTDYYTIENVKVVYTNEDGYISIIETDIRLKVPDVDFAKSAAKLNLEDFSLVANTSLINNVGDQTVVPEGATLVNGSSSVKISGSVYAGKKGMQVASQAGVQFVQDPTDKLNNVPLTYNLIAKSLNLDNASSNGRGLTIDKTFNTYVSDINVESSNFTGDGNMFVGDDMDVSGRNSNIILKGSYRGYGSEETISDGSSSILINGANTSLDFSNLNELVLSGHAYVGAKKYDADEDRLAFGSVYNKAGQYNSQSGLYGDIANKVLNSDKIEDAIDFDNQYEEALKSTEYDVFKTNREADEDDTIIPQNGSDVLMGESISVKANQLLYLVPSQCIGYVRNTNNQEIAKNPMTYEEYYKLTNTPDQNSTAYKEEYAKYRLSKGYAATTVLADEVEQALKTEFYNYFYTNVKNKPEAALKYEAVRYDDLWTKLGRTFTTSYKPVYRRVNGTVLVYLFMDFGGKSNKANEFFRTYCEKAPDEVNTYVNSYINSIKWNNRLNNNLTLAGNFFRYDNNTSRKVQVIEDTNRDSTKYYNMSIWQEEYKKKYTALFHTLRDNYDAIPSGQLTNDVFTNLVDTSALSSMNGMDFKHVDPADTSLVSAVVSTGTVIYPSGNCPANTAVIITSGDVFVDGNYDGLILAGGNIYICSRCSTITYNPTKVVKAMQLEYIDPVLNSSTHVYDALGASGQISYGVVTGGDSTTIKLTDLITYQNWKKE